MDDVILGFAIFGFISLVWNFCKLYEKIKNINDNKEVNDINVNNVNNDKIENIGPGFWTMQISEEELMRRQKEWETQSNKYYKCGCKDVNDAKYSKED